MQEADEWKRENAVLAGFSTRPFDARTGPMGRILINKTRYQYALLNADEVNFIKDVQLCYGDCGWSNSDKVIFAPFVPHERGRDLSEDDMGARLRARGYAFIERPHVESASLVVDGTRTLVLKERTTPLPVKKLLDPPPPLARRLAHDAAHCILMSDREHRSKATDFFSSPRSPEGLDEDREITSEPLFFPAAGWLQADCYLVNLTQWTCSQLARLHGDLSEELEYLRQKNGWSAGDVVTLCIDHTQNRFLEKHLMRKGVSRGKSLGDYAFDLPRW